MCNIRDKTRYNNLTNKLRKKLRDTCNETFKIFVRGLSAADYPIWKATKGFKRLQE